MEKRLLPKELYKIGEVMRHTGLSRQTIHNYTMLGLLTEDERKLSGHRLYGEDVFERIERIERIKAPGVEDAEGDHPDPEGGGAGALTGREGRRP